MSEYTDALGGRLPLTNPTDLTAEQREVYDGLTRFIVPWATETGFESATEDDRFIGPFNPALLNPATASALFRLQFTEIAHTSLSARVREVVILAVGAAWHSDYELYAHTAAARKVGIPEDAVHALARGVLPAGLSTDETIAFRLAHELSTTHCVDDELYREAETVFGTTGLNDIALLIGIYHTVCATLNMFAIPAPHEPRASA